MTRVAALTIKGVCLDSAGRVLLCRNHRAQWELPGGRPEDGEPLEACLVREIAEETGLIADVRDLIAAYPFEVLPERWVNVIVYGCELRHAATPTVSAEHERVAFVDLAEVAARELPDGYRQAIHSWRRRR